jgi:hypothetical protein
MKASPRSDIPARSESRRPARGSTCKVVFFYENFDAAIRCRMAFDSIAHTFGNGRPVEASSWSFSMLGATELSASILAEFNASMLAEASRADVIVIAAHGDKELPERIALSIETCLGRGGKSKPLLLALPADDSSDGASALCVSIEGIATRQGVRAMRGSDLQEPKSQRRPATIQPRFDAAGLALAHDSTAGVNPRWGIND